MPPYHAIVRGLCHDSTPLLLSVGDLGTSVAVCYVARCLAQPRRSGPGNISPAHQAAASTFQGAQAICRSHPPTLLCCLCTRFHTTSTTPPSAARSDARDPSAPSSGRPLDALLSACPLGLSRWAGPGELAYQRASEWWPLAAIVLHGLRGLFPRD